MPNWIPAEVDTIVFDAVGTLIFPNPPAADAYATIGRRFGSNYSTAAIGERFRKAIHRQEEIDRAANWQTSEIRERNRWQAIVNEVLDDVSDPAACFSILFDHFARPDSWRWPIETAHWLERLAQIYRIAIASNFDRRLDRVMSDQVHVPIFTSAAIGWRKPAPPFFHFVCNHFSRSPNQVLYVGDSIDDDYHGARKAGLHAVLFDPNHQANGPSISRLKNLADLLGEPRID